MSILSSSRPLPKVESFPPPWEGPTIPLEILPFYLAHYGYKSVGMDNFGRLVVQPKPAGAVITGSGLRLEEAALAAQHSEE